LGAVVVVGSCFFVLCKGVQWYINQPTNPMAQPGLQKIKIAFNEPGIEPPMTEAKILLNQSQSPNNILFRQGLVKKTNFIER